MLVRGSAPAARTRRTRFAGGAAVGCSHAGAQRPLLRHAVGPRIVWLVDRSRRAGGRAAPILARSSDDGGRPSMMQARPIPLYYTYQSTSSEPRPPARTVRRSIDRTLNRHHRRGQPPNPIHHHRIALTNPSPPHRPHDTDPSPPQWRRRACPPRRRPRWGRCCWRRRRGRPRASTCRVWPRPTSSRASGWSSRFVRGVWVWGDSGGWMAWM